MCIYVYVCVCVCVCVCVLSLHICLCMMYMPDALEGQKRTSSPLRLELQMIVNHLICVLGAKLGPSARALSVLNFGPISPAPLKDSLDGLYPKC